jgi:hypothetical protein
MINGRQFVVILRRRRKIRSSRRRQHRGVRAPGTRAPINFEVQGAGQINTAWLEQERTEENREGFFLRSSVAPVESLLLDSDDAFLGMRLSVNGGRDVKLSTKQFLRRVNAPTRAFQKMICPGT